jgi:hypothetical protein
VRLKSTGKSARLRKNWDRDRAEEGGGEAKLYQLLVAVVNTKVMFHVASTTMHCLCLLCWGYGS